MAFLMVNNFFCAFSKIPTKRTFVVLLFLKLYQSRNTKKNFWGGFSSKTKAHFFVGPQWYFLKVKFQICISAFVLQCKGSSLLIFTKNINIMAPWNCLKMKTLTLMCQNFGIGLLKSYLTFGYLTCSVRSKKKFLHSTLLLSMVPTSL